MAQVIAVIGSGGKTTAMDLLARQSGAHSVLITTTTHIYPMGRTLRDPSPETLAEALDRGGILCAGTTAGEGKLGPLTQPVLEAALAHADLVLYEADGSRHLPLKLHRPGEPVLLPGTDRCLVVAGLSALGKPVSEAVHRWELAWPGEPDRTVGTAEFMACVKETMAASSMDPERTWVFLNQLDAAENSAHALWMTVWLGKLCRKARPGSLHQEPDLYAWLTGD